MELDENKILEEEQTPEQKQALKELRAQKKRNRIFCALLIIAILLSILMIVELVFIFTKTFH